MDSVVRLLVLKIDRDPVYARDLSFDTHISELPQLSEPYAVFKLPPIARSGTTRGGPDHYFSFAQTFDSYRPSSQFLSQDVYDATPLPFTGDPNKRMVAVLINDRRHHWSSAMVRISIQVFLDKIAECEGREEGMEPLSFGWEEWFPWNSRYLPHIGTFGSFAFGPYLFEIQPDGALRVSDITLCGTSTGKRKYSSVPVSATQDTPEVTKECAFLLFDRTRHNIGGGPVDWTNSLDHMDEDSAFQMSGKTTSLPMWIATMTDIPRGTEKVLFDTETLIGMGPVSSLLLSFSYKIG